MTQNTPLTSASAAGAFDPTTPAPGSRYRWRIVDIVVGAVLGVATGLIFWAYNTPGNWLWTAADAALPGLSGLANGLWLLGGPLGALVIRRPGAAVFVETLAAVVSAVLGNQWGWSTVWIGIFQGVGAELVVLAVLYRRFGLSIALLSGVLAGVGCWFYSFITGGLVMTAAYNLIYVVTSAVSGAVFAGLLGWLITRGLARAGALQRFTAGRDAVRV